jgi:hypothetical protein
MLWYQTMMLDAGIPMLATSASMTMPSYSDQSCLLCRYLFVRDSGGPEVDDALPPIVPIERHNCFFFPRFLANEISEEPFLHLYLSAKSSFDHLTFEISC